MIDLFKVRMAPTVSGALEKVLNSGYIGQGPKVEEFEKLLGGFLKTPYVLTVNSCTSALHLALHLCKDLSGDHVLVSPLTCTATIWPILHNGLKLRWVDIDPHTGNMDLGDLARKITSYTGVLPTRPKAILVVHWGGYPIDYDTLREIQDAAERIHGYRPPIIEDAAHAFGASYKGRMVGGYTLEGGTWNAERPGNGNICCFSFQAIKHLTTGDGGAITLPSKKLYDRAKLLRWFGLDRESSPDMRCCQSVTEAGYKFHMNDIAATIGIENMKGIKQTVKDHWLNGMFYARDIARSPDIRLLDQVSGHHTCCWVYTIAVQRREAFVARMKEAGIAVSQVHTRCDKHPCVAQFKESLPNMDRFESEYIAIPSGWWVGDDERRYIVETIRKGW